MCIQQYLLKRPFVIRGDKTPYVGILIYNSVLSIRSEYIPLLRIRNLISKVLHLENQATGVSHLEKQWINLSSSFLLYPDPLEK